MNISAKEIITLAAILSDRLTKGLSQKELAALRLFVGQLNFDINTIYAAETLKKD